MPPRKKAQEETDPDRVSRQAAGRYRTADGRFEIQQSAATWFVIDTEQADELGQPLMHGPYASLKAAQAGLADARKTRPMPRGGAARDQLTASRAAKRKASEPSKPPEPPPSWIDKLPSTDASEVRKLIRALTAAGLAEARAEELVRADRDGLLPAVAIGLLERRIDEIVDELPEDERGSGRKLAGRLAAALTAEGTKTKAPLPRWTLVEIGSHGEPPNRRIVIERR